ncbi:MAG: hypothetical protein LUE12_08730 [Ruminococcus sp.]|nr:hypothetical protein [Ruminococcus sp.]
MAKKEATYSQKSSMHDEHKHLFGSGGKSDFIINMSKEATYKLCGIYSMIAMILVALSAVPYYISKAVSTSDEYMMLRTEDNETLAFLIMTLLVAAGFLGLLIFMICCEKKEIYIAKNKALLIFVGILVSGLLSTLFADDIGTAFFGYLDRAEGLITIIGYIGFFAIGMTLTNEAWRKRAANCIVIIGLVNAIMGILQSIPALSDYIPSYYNYLFIDYRTNVDVAEYFNSYAGYDASYAADGFCCSPFALGALLTIAIAFAMSNAVYTNKHLKRLANLFAAGIMTAACILTQTFPAMLGAACVLVITLVMAIVNYSKEKKLAAVQLSDKEDADEAESDDEESEIKAEKYSKGQIFASVLSIVAAAAIFAGVFLTDNFRMRNEHIMFTDSFERLGISYEGHSDHEDGIYPTLWYEGWLCLESNNLLLGVGPDNWTTMYNGGEGMEIDRSYNEYLDTAITRGLLGAVLYIAMLVITLIKAIRILKTKKSPVAYGAFAAFLGYAAQAFFNISTASSTPFFYLTIGLIWSYEAAGKIKIYKKAKSDKKK